MILAQDNAGNKCIIDFPKVTWKHVTIDGVEMDIVAMLSSTASKDPQDILNNVRWITANMHFDETTNKWEEKYGFASRIKRNSK